MVGEIRDLETAEIAIKAAQTGHLVLSTLHTNDAPANVDTLGRYGREALRHRNVGEPDHRAATRTPTLRQLQKKSKRFRRKPWRKKASLRKI